MFSVLVYWLGLVAQMRIGSSAVHQVVGLMTTSSIGDCVSSVASDDKLVNLLAGGLPKNIRNLLTSDLTLVVLG
jgi:hypothetical protein